MLMCNNCGHKWDGDYAMNDYCEECGSVNINLESEVDEKCSMYTLLWTGKGIDGWTTFMFKKHLESKIRALMKEGFLVEDMMVFLGDNYIVPEDDGEVIA